MLRDDQLLTELVGDGARTHGERLPLEVERALTAAGITFEAIDLLAVVAGPGSFTGLRVGIAAMQGLAFARALRIVPVSALEAVARQAATERGEPDGIAAWIDAHRGEVFSALYDARSWRELSGPASEAPDETLRRWAPLLPERPVLFAGDGAVRYAGLIRETLGAGAEVQVPAPPLAAQAARIAAAHPERAVAPGAIAPVYVRKPDAEIARDRARVRLPGGGPA